MVLGSSQALAGKERAALRHACPSFTATIFLILRRFELLSVDDTDVEGTSGHFASAVAELPKKKIPTSAMSLSPYGGGCREPQPQGSRLKWTS